MTLYISRSRPRSAFKDLLGNANHLIITALVGLDAVERGIVTEVPEDLHAAWSPKDAEISAKRSRRLLLDMVLIRAIDAVDVYLREAVRKPALIQSSDFRRDLDSAGLSIFKKLQAVERHLPNLDTLPLAIVFLIVAWRNRSAHSEADLDAPQHHLDVLQDKAIELSDRFRGLDVEMLLGGYEAVRPTTFKEVASLINAAHHLVAELDARLLKALDVERFLKNALWAYLGSSQRPNERIEQTRMRRAISVWGKDPVDRPGAVLRLLNQLGFSMSAPDAATGAEVSEALVKFLQGQTPKSILAWAHVPE
ncbi:hypothetical protein PYR71_10160 [Rhizobium sp. MC63]|uniref:Uncharacterized protein n=1 Tax=Rhizobium mulingense TaxID=3031128 RepID=A0ACC6MT57_9HYPH|nr:MULTISPECIES: hypothetical protein [unclassified Rhizobium]MDF0696869.1 hypothetical protein [Rhizobium sp. MC63]MEA3516535.1 hypothetical protein [Rhizobium sp. MJ31]